jgi:hypothetical protein
VKTYCLTSSKILLGIIKDTAWHRQRCCLTPQARTILVVSENYSRWYATPQARRNSTVEAANSPC